MEKKEGRDLSPDDDSRKTGDVEDVEENIDKEGGNTAVVVEVTPIMETNWNRFNSVCVSLIYTFTGMLGVICFGLTSKHFLPVLKPGGASGLDKDERNMVHAQAFGNCRRNKQ